MTEHIDAWLESLRRENRSPRTLYEYGKDARTWIEAGEPDPGEWISDMLDRKFSPATINRRRYALSSFFRWLVAEGYADSNPFADRTRALKEPQKRIETLTIAEVAKLIEGADCVSPRCAAMVALMATSGIRVSEALTLLLDDLDMEERTAWVTGKGSKDRFIRFGDVAAERIEKWLEVRPASDLLFCSTTGNQVDYEQFRKELEKAAWWADLKDVNPHKLRHTFATLSLQAKLPITDVKDMLGHESISTTERYIHRDRRRAWDDYGQHPLSA